MADDKDIKAAGGTPPEKAKRALGVCVIDDGYTLTATLTGAKGTLGIKYRPALPEEVYQYRTDLTKAADGVAVLHAKAVFLSAHLDDLTGVVKRTPAGLVPIKYHPRIILEDAGYRRALGAEYIDDAVNAVSQYTPGEWEEDAKNS
jgi:hypothetical protein